tara:strand:+ start:1686 stop:1961 length:276 start_codon:yes stop_codon:yes gene_type:complete
MDIFEVVLLSIMGIGLFGLIISVIIAWTLKNWWRSLNVRQRSAIFSLLIVFGLVLIVSVVGSPIGIIMILLAVFLQVFSAVSGTALEDSSS